SEEHTSELQSPDHLVCRLLLEKKNTAREYHPANRRPRAYRAPDDRVRAVGRASASGWAAPQVCFFFNDSATPEIYTLSLHDALPISCRRAPRLRSGRSSRGRSATACRTARDRKSTRLNSSHQIISYAVFCLKKK